MLGGRRRRARSARCCARGTAVCPSPRAARTRLSLLACGPERRDRGGYLACAARSGRAEVRRDPHARSRHRDCLHRARSMRRSNRASTGISAPPCQATPPSTGTRTRVTSRSGVCVRGRFEHYLALFRRVVLPLVHSRDEIAALFEPRPPEARRRYFDEVWNNRRWRALTRVFFSRTVMGRIGRDPSFFRFVEVDVAASISKRIERALTEGEPAANPYLRWIVQGQYGDTLPHAWRAANFEAIRAPHRQARAAPAIRRRGPRRAHPTTASTDSTCRTCSSTYRRRRRSRCSTTIARCGRAGGRVAYWNMMVPRGRPQRLARTAARTGRGKPAVAPAGSDVFLRCVPRRRTDRKARHDGRRPPACLAAARRGGRL